MAVECRGLKATKERWGPRHRDASIVPSHPSVLQHLASHTGNDHDTVKRAEALLVVDAQLRFAVVVFADTAFFTARRVAFDTGKAFSVDPHTHVTK